MYYLIKVKVPIRISKEVRTELKMKKIYSKEAYEDVLRRLLNMPERRFNGDKIE
jgi:hypothetical protein